MDVSLILKVGGVGLLVSVLYQILTKSGREEQAMMVNIAGIVIVLLMLMEEIGNLLNTVRSIFGI